jgi:hypothetical protein
VVLLLACVLTFTLVAAEPAAAGLTRKEQTLLKKINGARANHGRVKLRVLSKLQSGAHSWAVYLQRNDLFRHGSLASGVSENLAWISCQRRWARKIVRMWLRSSGRRANLLDRGARYVGVGVSTGRAFGFRCTHIAVARFKTPPSLTAPGFYAPTSPWNTPVPANATADPNSTTMVQSLLSAGGQSGFSIAVRRWTRTLYFADETAPRRTVSLTASWAPATSMRGVPIPANAVPDPAGDGHMVIVDPSTGCEYDFWQAERDADGTWSASWANATYSTGEGFYAHGLSTTGSGAAGLAGLILPEELAAGAIEHALFFSYAHTKAGGPVRPATEADGTSTITGAIPEGARLQLDPSLDLSTLGLNSWQLVIARALQRYGMILGDTGTGVSLYAQNPLSPLSTLYPWSATDDYAYLPQTLLAHMRVLTMGSQFSPTYKLVPTSCATFQ